MNNNMQEQQTNLICDFHESCADNMHMLRDRDAKDVKC